MRNGFTSQIYVTVTFVVVWFGFIFQLLSYLSFGSKLGFSRILQTLYGPFWRWSRIRVYLRRKWTDLDEISRTLSTFREILGAIRAVARAGEPGEILFFFCQVSNARFYRFPVGQISWNLTITRRSVRWWILSEQNFGNFSVRGCSKKHTKVEFFFNVLRLQASSNSAMIIDRQKFITKWSLYGMSSFHFAVGITQSHSLAYTLRTRNLPKFPATPDADWRHATTLTVKVGVTWWRHHATPKER